MDKTTMGTDEETRTPEPEVSTTIENEEWFGTTNGSRPERRGRGRPKLTDEEKAERKAEREDNRKADTFGFVSQKTRVGRPPKKHVPTYMSAEQANKTADTIIEMMESFAREAIDDKAVFTQAEKFILYATLPQYLQTIEISAVSKMNSILAPLGITAVFAMFGIRCYRLFMEKYKREHGESVETTPVENVKVDETKTAMENDEKWKSKVPQILVQQAAQY